MRRPITILATISSLLLAQQPAAVPTQGPATFATSSNLVVVNVTVKDKSGKLINGLKKEDFTILEDGKPQSITVFELEKLGTDLLPSLEPVKEFKKRDDKPSPAAAQVAKQPTRAEVRHQDKRLLAMFFDFSTMQPAEQIRAKDAATKFIQTQMTSSDMVAILTYTNRIKVIEEFTDDRERLLQTITKFRIGEGSENAEGVVNTDDADDSGGFTPDDTEFNIFNTDQKLSALESAAKRLAMYPEKKALVYFSSGVGTTGVDNQAQLNSTINAAVRANVAFFPIDARGLVASAPAGDASQASP